MALPLLAAFGISSGANLLGDIVGGIFSSSEKEKEGKRLDALFKTQSENVARKYKTLQATQEGQTSIDPEAALAYANAQKATSNAMAKAQRVSTNSNEALSSVAHLANNEMNQIQKISAAEGARRRIAAENAAKTGVAGAEAVANLEFDKDQAKRGAYADIDRVIGSYTDKFSGLAGDFMSANLFEKLYGAK